MTHQPDITLRCVDGRLMRHDPQSDDPYLQTDLGVCPECKGRGCEVPKVLDIYEMPGSNLAMLAVFSKPLTHDEMVSFHDYVKDWVP